MKAYQRAVRFEINGIFGRCDKNDWITVRDSRYELEDLDTDNMIRRAIHKVRIGEWKEPKVAP